MLSILLISAAMVVVRESRHPKSLSPQMQLKVVMLRRSKLSWPQIRKKVKNREGRLPSVRHCGEAYKRVVNAKKDVCYKYHKCGRKAWKVTPAITSYIVRRLLSLRKICVCTSTTLQREVLRDHHTVLAPSTIRKILVAKGYGWRPRTGKRLYSQEEKEQRSRIAGVILAMTPAEFLRFFSICMDGVILSLAPDNPIDRENYCRTGETHVWRKPDEGDCPSLAGHDDYIHQIPAKRLVPMWGGVSAGGFAVCTFHEKRKINQDDWAKAVTSGKVVKALRKMHPDRVRGPWRILCDNESFLNAPASREAHRSAGIVLWQIPARSPDMNPAELFWAWLRKQLRAMDLADLRANRPPLEKTQLKQRVQALCASARAQAVARKCYGRLRKNCQKIVDSGGAAV